MGQVVLFDCDKLIKAMSLSSARMIGYNMASAVSYIHVWKARELAPADRFHRASESANTVIL